MSVEQQASSEIAEFTWNDHAEEFLMEHYPNIRGKWRFLVPILGAFAEKAERDTRERVAQQQRENVTDLINLAGSIVRRNYLPSLERCRTIRDARSEIERYDSSHVDLAMRIKAVAERIRGKE